MYIFRFSGTTQEVRAGQTKIRTNKSKTKIQTFLIIISQFYKLLYIKLYNLY